MNPPRHRRRPSAGRSRNVVGLGIDAVDIDRFSSVLARRPGLAERLFSVGERAWAARLVNPGPTLAARFAAKEAVMKALGVGLGAFAFRDVEVLRRVSGQPALSLTGRAATLAVARGVGHWQLSITHTDSQASAIVVALS